MNKAFGIFLAAICGIFFMAYVIVAVCLNIGFDRNCGGYLARAANANTIEIATQELVRAVDYMERTDRKSGFTSIIYNTPDEDLGYWYRNMSSALAELKSVRPDASQLERTNILMKLRESLISHGKSGDELETPNGVVCAPHNTAYAIWGWGSLVLMIIFIIGAAASDY